MSSKPTTNQEATRRPERKIGRVAFWRNAIQTAAGPKEVWSITISPRRYRDAKTGEWKDSPSFRPADLPALVFDLQKAIDYLYDNRLGAQDSEPEENGEVPF
jgi:hypothetical protein